VTGRTNGGARTLGAPVAGLLSPGRQLGAYVLEEPLGTGAMGVVYRSRSVELGAVAVKALRPELGRSDVYRRRLERELRVSRAVSHPNLLPVVDAGESDGIPYVVSPLVQGGSLAARLRDGPLEPRAAIGLARAVAGALGAVHRAGLVHRDVKPSNVLLEPDDSPKLADLGLATGAAYTVLTRPGQAVGTPQYLAPELIEGSAPASVASDVYALGCLVYECLTGSPPFTGGALEVALAQLEEEPPAPPGVRPALAEAVLAALAKEPTARPRTAVLYGNLLHAALAMAGRGLG
jgi:serine/threonine-protein kinase